MKTLRFPVLLALVTLLLLPSCGGESADEPAEETTAAAEAPLSGVPQAQAAYDESLELWSSDWFAAVAKLHEAIQSDPEFLEAHSLLSYRYAWIHQQFDRSDSIAQNALTFAENALALDPDAAASYRAIGAYYYRIEKDYPRALEIYSKALDLYPESGHFLRMQAHVARREGDWDRALEVLERAEALAPSLDAIQATLENHYFNRRFEAAAAAAQEHARRNPQGTFGPSNSAWLAFDQHGDTGPIREFLASRPTGWVGARWNMEMLDRDFAAALAAVDASDTEVFSGQYGMNPRGVLRGIALRAMGDEAGAMAAFQEAREAMEGMFPELEDDCRVHGALGRIYASMGMREEAIQAAMHAVELLPPEKDALIGPFNLIALAGVYATLGEPEAAVERLEYLLSIPSGITRWGLRSDPRWDPIREHPSFQALLEG